MRSLRHVLAAKPSMPHSNYSEVGDRLTGELSGTRPKDWLTSESRASSSGQRTTSTPAAAMLLAAGDIESTARSLGVWSERSEEPDEVNVGFVCVDVGVGAVGAKQRGLAGCDVDGGAVVLDGEEPG